MSQSYQFEARKDSVSAMTCESYHAPEVHTSMSLIGPSLLFGLLGGLITRRLIQPRLIYEKSICSETTRAEPG